MHFTHGELHYKGCDCWLTGVTINRRKTVKWQNYWTTECLVHLCWNNQTDPQSFIYNLAHFRFSACYKSNMIEDKKNSENQDKTAFTQSGLFIIVYLRIARCYREYQNVCVWFTAWQHFWKNKALWIFPNNEQTLGTNKVFLFLMINEKLINTAYSISYFHACMGLE